MFFPLFCIVWTQNWCCYYDTRGYQGIVTSHSMCCISNGSYGNRVGKVSFDVSFGYFVTTIESSLQMGAVKL